MVSDNGSVYNVNSSKFQNTAISAYTAASNNIDQNTTDTSLLWTAAGISDPSTIEVLNENQEILYTSEKVPVAATIKWSITNTETINNQTTFTLSGFIILPDGYTWSSSSTIDERITGKITIDLTPVKVSSLYHDQLIYNHSYQAGLVLLKLDTLPTEITYFNSTNNSTQINSIQSTAFNSTDKYPMLILENGDIIDNILNASNCTLTAIFYPSDGNNKAYITFTVIADTLPDGYEWADTYNNSISITFYIEEPLTVSEIKLPYIGMSYDGSPSNETIITLNEYYTISLSDTYNDSSNNLIINNNTFIYGNDLVTDFFTVLTRWHMGDQNDENGVSSFYNMYEAFPGVASDGSSIYTEKSGVPVLCTIDTSAVDSETRIGLYITTCELNKNASLYGYDLVNSNPNTITIKLDVTPATNSILNDEPLANDITDDIENDSSDENISTE